MRADAAGDLRGVQRVPLLLGEIREHLALERNHRARRLLSRFHAGLMVGVDVHERRVEADRTLEQRDQHADGERADLAHRERDALPTLFVKRLARAEEKAAEKIAAGHAGFHQHALARAVAQHLDEDSEEVQHALAKLLHVSVLVGRALVAIDADALVHDLAVEVELLAERFHDELLKILREQLQSILVRQHDHVLAATAVAEEMPHERELRRRILRGVRLACDFIASLRAGEHRVDVEPLQRGGQQAHGAQFARASADPVPHRETAQPALAHRDFVQLAPSSRDGDDVLGKIESGLRPRCFGFEHSVARFLRAAALADDDRQRLAQLAAELREHLVHAVGIGVIEKVNRHLVRRRLTQRRRDELRSERRATDADDEHVLERALRARDFAGVNFSRERLDRGECFLDGLPQFRLRRERGVAQPVMADHALLVGIRDRALLQLRHRGKSLLHARLHLREEVLREIHAAHVDGQAERREVGEMFLETMPELFFGELHNDRGWQRNNSGRQGKENAA